MSSITYGEIERLEEEYYSNLEKEDRLVRRIQKVHKKQLEGDIDELMSELYDLREQIYYNVNDLYSCTSDEWDETWDETVERYQVSEDDELNYTLEDVLNEKVEDNDEIIKNQLEANLNHVQYDIRSLKEEELHLLEELQEISPKFKEQYLKAKKDFEKENKS